MRHLSRPTALRIVAILSFVLGLYGLTAISYIARGVEDITQTGDSPPYFVLVAIFVFGIIRLIAAYGTWHYQRWGVVLILFVSAIDGLFALPGLFFAPTLEFRISAIIGIISSVVSIVLCLWRDRTRVAA